MSAGQRGERGLFDLLENGLPATRSSSESHKQHQALTAALWSIQAILALLFLFAGSMKLVLPLEVMTAQMPLPGLLLRFIGVCEVTGALGLIIPGLLRIQRGLTPLAACGLVVIMPGAVVLTLASGEDAAAMIPLVVGTLAACIAYGRRHSLFFTGRFLLKEPGEGNEREKTSNIPVEAGKRAEKEEEIVGTRLLQGESDVFFCDEQSRLAKACGRVGPEPESIAGESLRTHQLRNRPV